MWNLIGNRIGFGLALILMLGLTLKILPSPPYHQPPVWLNISYYCSLIFFLLSGVARCHALNWSGWRLLVLPLPLVGQVFIFLLLLTPGKQLTKK